jgi:hypothetical protein
LKPLASEPAAIDLHVADLGHLFNSLDPSPFHDRDLNSDAACFIREEVADRADQADLAIVVHLPEHQLGHAPAVVQAVHRFFGRERAAAERELRQLMRFARFALIAGLLAVFVVVAIGRALASVARVGTFVAAVAESLTIVAWVFLWRPAELLLFERWPIKQRISMFRRLERIDVRCTGYAG